GTMVLEASRVQRCVSATLAVVNATPPVIDSLTAAGVNLAQLARIAGVNRSSATRWMRGAQPRGRSLQRLERAAALLHAVPEQGDVQFGVWLTQPNPRLGGVLPVQW